MRIFKKVIALAIAAAMLCSFSALAAHEATGTTAVEGTDGKKFEVNLNSDASMLSVLAYTGTSLADANIAYVDQYAAGADVIVTLGDDAESGEYKVLVGGTGVATAASTSYTYVKPVTEFDVTLPSSVANGYVEYDADSLTALEVGTEVVFNFYAHMGFELSELTVNGTSVKDAMTGNTYTLTVAADLATEGAIAVVPTFTAVAAADPATGAVYTSSEVYDSGEYEGDEDPAHAGLNTNLTFGKVVPVAGKTVKAMGMKVEQKVDGNWADFTTPGGYGPKFAAKGWTSDFMYGIRFVGFNAGTYRVISYVEYTDGAETTGTPVEFVVQ